MLDINTIRKYVKAVIFDLDGTLVDSMWMWKQIDIEFLGRYGLECPEDLQDIIEGMSFSETAVYFKERFSIPMELDEMKDCWNRMAHEKYAHEVFFKPGAQKFLKDLKEAGITAGIATSNSIELVSAVYDALSMKDYIQVITTGCEVEKGKPAPDVFLETARRLNVDPAECLVFEDVPSGIQAGKNAGMLVCAVDDTHSKHLWEQKKEMADAYIESYEDLYKVRSEGRTNEVKNVSTL